MNARTAGLRRWMGGSLAALLGLAAIATATTVVPPDFAQLVNETDYVVRAVVKSVKSEYRNGPDGRMIVSFVELEVRETILGTPPAHVVLEMLGGQIGDQELAVVGAPKFKVGDEDILFVSGNGRTFYPLFALMHGRYPILREPGTGRRYVARSNLEPLTDTTDVARPIESESVTSPKPLAADPATALTPEQFAARIKSAVNPNHVRVRLR